MLPAIIAIIILLVGDNIARAFSLARFQLILLEAHRDPIDISLRLFTPGRRIGLRDGLYRLWNAVCRHSLRRDGYTQRDRNMPNRESIWCNLKLPSPKISIFQNCFEDILEQYTDSYKLQRVKTADFGSLFEIVYAIQPKEAMDQKESISCDAAMAI